MSSLEFNTYNIALTNGRTTSPGGPLMHDSPILKAALQTIELCLPTVKKSDVKVIDIGCAEGGYAAEFARAGYDSLGIELRESNFERCKYVLENIGLNNLLFVKDDAMNAHKYGVFDVVFCCGLLYHLENPVQFLKNISKVNSRLLILHTHYTLPNAENVAGVTKSIMKKIMPSAADDVDYPLSDMTEHESVRGRWYREFSPELAVASREKLNWASFDNHQSFWINKNDLLQVLRDCGYSLIYEQYNYLNDLKNDDYREKHTRGMFIAVKP